MTVQELERVRAWAQARVVSGAEPPWATHLYGRLSETIRALFDGMAASGHQLDSEEGRPKLAIVPESDEAA